MEFSTRGILHLVLEWSYSNDRKLYDNLDDVFDAHSIRSSIEDNEKSVSYEVRKAGLTKANIIKYLLQCLELCDYHDTLRFNWTFFTGSRKDRGGYLYKLNEGDDLYVLRDPIRKRLEKFDKLSKDPWHISADQYKYKYFREQLVRLISKDKFYTARLFPVPTGNTICFDTLHIQDDKIVVGIVNYILDNHIVEDTNYKSFEIQNHGIRNAHVVSKISESYERGPLLYLNSIELYEALMHDNIPLKNVRALGPVWSYIKQVYKEDKDATYPTKFFITF